jgi:hypothetical protein
MMVMSLRSKWEGTAVLQSVAKFGFGATLANTLEGVRSVGAAKYDEDLVNHRLRGTAALQVARIKRLVPIFCLVPK